jgi:oligopeptide/dipeptide ABC transporter ATP-binding protein
MALLMITHDLGVVTQMCEQVIVMYAGRVVEQAPTRALFKHPRHPSTAGLLNSIPRLGHKQDKLPTIAGVVPNPENRAAGCHFAARCPRVMARCRVETPALNGQAETAETHTAACWNPLS